MNDIGIPDDMILPLAGLGTALCLMLVFLAFRRRSDSRDQTLALNATPEEPGNPPGWVTSDNSPPPGAAAPAAPPAKAKMGMIETLSAIHTLMDPATLDRAKQMKDQGASMDDILAALHDMPAGAGDMHRDMVRAIVENALGGAASLTPGSSGFSFRANVSVNTRSGHDSFQMDNNAFARARGMIEQGSSLDDVCRALSPDYGAWEPGHQKRFQQIVTTVLRMGGVDKEKLK